MDLQSKAAKPGSMRLLNFKDTKLCKFYAAGTCTRGASCNFAHSRAQVKEQPDFSKTRLCPDFMRSGRCRDGSGCKFAHGKGELKTRAAKIAREQAIAAESSERALTAALQGQVLMLQPNLAVFPMPVLLGQPSFMGGMPVAMYQAQEQAQSEEEVPDPATSTSMNEYHRSTSLSEPCLPWQRSETSASCPSSSSSETRVSVKNTFIHFKGEETASPHSSATKIRRSRSNPEF